MANKQYNIPLYKALVIIAIFATMFYIVMIKLVSKFDLNKTCIVYNDNGCVRYE